MSDVTPKPVQILASTPGGAANLNTAATNADARPPDSTAIDLLTIAQLYGFDGAAFDRLRSAASNADALATLALGNLQTIAQLFGYNGSTFDRIRIANVFKTVVATAAGGTNVWTPASGKKFRLMGYTISVAGTLAATGTNLIELVDGATVIKNHEVNMIQTPTANISGGDSQIGVDLGQGQLSAAANNVLQINLAHALATGGAAINTWGTEE